MSLGKDAVGLELGRQLKIVCKVRDSSQVLLFDALSLQENVKKAVLPRVRYRIDNVTVAKINDDFLIVLGHAKAAAELRLGDLCQNLGKLVLLEISRKIKIIRSCHWKNEAWD